MLAARWPDRHWPPVTPAPASAQLPKPPPSKQQASPIRNYTATLTSTRPNNIEPSRITFEEKNSGDKCDQCHYSHDESILRKYSEYSKYNSWAPTLSGPTMQQINLRNQSQAHVVCWSQGLGLLDIKPDFSSLS